MNSLFSDFFLDLLLNKPFVFNGRYQCYFFLNGNKLSLHMAQISEHINYSNWKKYSYDQTRKLIINLGSEKGKNNDNSYVPNHPPTEFITNEHFWHRRKGLIQCWLEILYEKNMYIFSKFIINITLLFNMWNLV